MNAFQFQINVRVRVPRGERPRADEISEVVSEWIETGSTPTNWEVSITIWDGKGRKRQIDDIGTDSRGETLREQARSALQRRAITFRKMG